MTTEKMIPLSVIDALIKSIGDSGGAVYGNIDVIEILEELKKKEAIPIPTQPTIPMSVVDALITKLEKQQKEMGATLQRLYKIEMLQEIKKEAISTFGQGELEQKIRDKILHLEDHGISIQYDDTDVIRMLKELLNY